MLRIAKGVFLLIWLMMASVRADYVVSVSNQGRSAASVGAGGKIDLDVVLATEVSDYHNSAIFRIIFSTPGMVYESYKWMEPYVNGTGDDDSKPISSGLPVVLTANTLSGAAYSNNVVDIELSNVATPKLFGSGILCRLTFSVPTNYAGPEDILIQAEPDTFANRFTLVTAKAGAPFKLHVFDYARWKLQVFGGASDTISAPSADPDRDGVPNAIEYAFGLDPLSTQNVKPVPLIQTGTNQTQIFYSRLPSRGDIGYLFDYSTNLVQWTSAVKDVDYSEQSQVETGVDKENVVLTFPGPPSTRRYFRFKMILQ